MGCGTGPLKARDDDYEVMLTFDGGGIFKNDPVYTNFQSALDWLLKGLEAVGASGKSEPNLSGNDVTSIKVTVSGPLLNKDPEKFNRAFNRLLWGARFRKSPDKPSPSGRTVTPSDTRYLLEET